MTETRRFGFAPGAVARSGIALLECLPILLVRPVLRLSQLLVVAYHRVTGGYWRESSADKGRPIEERVETILGRMSQLEKLHQMHGIGQMRATKNHRLGIPAFAACDGPHGVGEAVWRYLYRHLDKSTALPCSLNIASTWDPEQAFRQASVIAREAEAKARNWVLAPCIDMPRDPRAGRIQEAYGEDPILTAAFGRAFVRGIQAEGLIACVKHFCCHTQELNTRKFDVRLDERTLRELYLPAFKACVDAGAMSVMTAHNRINGVNCATSSDLLTKILRDEWGFEGVVVSDWKDVTDGPSCANAGVDIEMPKEVHYGRALSPHVEAGRVSQKVVDEANRRILGVKLRAGLFERRSKHRSGIVNCKSHRQLAQELARASIVLLQNKDNLLPLSIATLSSLAVVGPNAKRAMIGDEGSSQVRPYYRISPLRGLRDRLDRRADVTYARGSGHKTRHPKSLQQAITKARSADAAVICVGLDPRFEGETIDRLGNDLALPPAQVELIEEVAKVQPKTIVVNFSGGAIAMSPWSESVASILHAGYPGEQGGYALADLLLGRAAPSAKLVLSFPSTNDQLPTRDFPDPDSDDFSEGMFTGYRHFDRSDTAPLFPFGHGLTYTEFVYSDLRLDSTGKGESLRIRVSVAITNEGKRDGEEIAQLYTSPVDSPVERPLKELRGFSKLTLAAGETKRAEFELGARDLSYYDPRTGEWIIARGETVILVGASSTDIRLSGNLQI